MLAWVFLRRSEPIRVLQAALATHWPAVDALDRSQWPRTDLEIIMVRSCLFVSQAVAGDMIAAGREKEVKEIQQAIDTVAPPLPENL